jgi:hypothetical protein
LAFSICESRNLLFARAAKIVQANEPMTASGLWG